MFHEPRLAIVGLSRDRQVRHAVALGMLQQIFELLQDLVGLRRTVSNCPSGYGRCALQSACLAVRVFWGRGARHSYHSGSTIPSKASTLSAIPVGSGNRNGNGGGLRGAGFHWSSGGLAGRPVAQFPSAP